MKSYPVWCVVDAPNYNSSKSYGTREYTTTDVKIGSSATNSFDFVKTEIKKSVLSSDDKMWKYIETLKGIIEIHVFEFMVDGNVIKKTYYDPNGKRIIAIDEELFLDNKTRSWKLK